MKRKVVKISLLVIALMISMIIPILAVTAKKKEWKIDPIIIDELGIGLPGFPGLPWADYADEPWLKGSGTFEDPYMIKNVVIDAKGSNFFCMMILNSEAYFKIMDCTFSNTGPGPDAGKNAALILVGTQNGVIFKNEIFDCGIGAGQGSGIALIASSNNKLQKNLCHDNAGPGIYLQYSNDNVLRQNLCKRNQWGIMIADGSNFNEVTKNDCYNNYEVGIFLVNDANDNSISKNECSENGHGIQILYAHGNDIIDNVCSENFFEQGILIMTWASDNTITGNRCFKNQRSGIVLYNMAYNNMITDNLCYENLESGIVIDSSFQNTVENNLAYRNAFTGMQVYNNAENNMIAWNIFTGNYIGIQLLYSYGNEISNNVCNENLDSGISVESSDGNTIADNNCSENGGPGIKLETSHGNLITLNLCNWNLHGISIGYSSNFNEVTENDCFNNSEQGILIIDNSDYNKITNNECKGNLDSGIVVLSSNGNIIMDNFCSEHVYAGIAIAGWYGNAEDNIICRNNLENNNMGVYFSYVSNNDVFRNNIKHNIHGIFMHRVCEFNLIYHNNVVENDIQVFDLSPGLNNWYNGYMLEGNYWSDYGGADGDNDGIGETPWPDIGYDLYPFMLENGWDIYTVEEMEILNAFYDPDSNRLAGGNNNPVQSTETSYLIFGMKQLFSERVDREFCPPYTLDFIFPEDWVFQRGIWYFDEIAWGEPGYIEFFYIIFPPDSFSTGTYSFQMLMGFYNYGVWMSVPTSEYIFDVD